jgi:hypothetical protein
MHSSFLARTTVRGLLLGIVCSFSIIDHAVAQSTVTEQPNAPEAPQPQPETPPQPTYTSTPNDELAPSATPAAEPAPARAPAQEAAAQAPAADPNEGIVSFKPGKGLDIKSNDGNFALNIQLKTQLLNEVHKLKSADKATEDFFVRRMRLAFQGNVFSKNIKYKIELTSAAAEMGRTDPRTAERLVAGSDPSMMMTPATLDRDEISQTPLLESRVWS